MKSICKNRQSYSLPSGFVITVLIEKSYATGNERLDLDQFIGAVYDRLCRDLWVRHPVVEGEWLIDADSQHKTRNLRDLLETALDDLAELDLPSCTPPKAPKAWKKVLRTTFFDDRIAEAEREEKAKSTAAVGGLASAPKPWAPPSSNEN